MTRALALALVLLVTPAAHAATPKPIARTKAAVSLAGGSLQWHVRESFVRYINAGEGTKASRGATAGAAVTTPATDVPLVYDFGFRFRSGWRDADRGRARLLSRGTVLFSYSAHGIRLTASDPEVELRGARSRVVMRVRNGSAKAKRVALFNLDLGGAASTTVSPDGRTVTYEQVPGSVPKGTGDTVFNGFYQPGEPFGWVTLTLRAKAR